MPTVCRSLVAALFSLCALCLASIDAKANPSPPPNREAFEGVYTLHFDCQSLGRCPPEISGLQKLVILRTSTPELLGSGLGRVITLTNSTIEPAYTFFDALLLPDAQSLKASSVQGAGGQPAELSLTLDAEGSFRGSLINLLSAEALTFRAEPLATLAKYLREHPPEPCQDADVAGTYTVRWAHSTGSFLVKNFGSQGFAGRIVLDSPSDQFYLNSGILDPALGLFTFVANSHGVQLKFFLFHHQGRWSGFSIATLFGTVAPIELDLAR